MKEDAYNTGQPYVNAIENVRFFSGDNNIGKLLPLSAY